MVKTTSANGGPDQTYPSDTERIAYTPEDIQTMLGVPQSTISWLRYIATTARSQSIKSAPCTAFRKKVSITGFMEKRRKNNQNGDFTNGQFVLSLKWLIVESYKKETT